MRFLHTADWQLGMPARFLDDEARARYGDARLAAIKALGRIAESERCAFVLVCGDVFDSNQLDRQTVTRALEAMRTISVPVYLLPGNHDPLDAAAIYRRDEFVRQRPDNVHVLDRPGLHELPGNVELVAAPWLSKRPLSDLIADQIAALGAAPAGVLRIIAGHGAVDTLSPDAGNPALIHSQILREAIGDGRVHYVALGDRHSRTDVGIAGRVWYSGTQEVTDYDETQPGDVLVVDLDNERCQVNDRHVGTWRFVRQEHRLSSAEDIDAFEEALSAVPDKERTLVKLSLIGSLSLRQRARLDELLEHNRHLFAALETWERHTDLVTLPDDDDLGDLGLSGFGALALDDLREQARMDSESGRTAQDALGLLYRLAGGTR